jgi:hypothetical protein
MSTQLYTQFVSASVFKFFCTQTHTKQHKVSTPCTCRTFLTSRVERGPVRTVRSHAISHAVSTYIRQGYSYKLVKPLRRPEPVTVQYFVTSSLYLRACGTRRLPRVYVHETFRQGECVVLYLRATYTPTCIYVQVEESFISVYSSNNDPEYYTHTTLHQRTQRYSTLEE